MKGGVPAVTGEASTTRCRVAGADQEEEEEEEEEKFITSGN